MLCRAGLGRLAIEGLPYTLSGVRIYVQIPARSLAVPVNRCARVATVAQRSSDAILRKPRHPVPGKVIRMSR
jgi:hypothetical protein